MLWLSASGGPVDLVLDGGGIKAIGLVGALSALEESGYRPRQVAGSSAGAIVAGLVAAGYSSSELRSVIEGENFTRFLDTRWYGRLPGIGRPIALLLKLGFHAGDRLHARLAELLTAKDVRTFGDLRTKALEWGIAEPLQVVVSDVTARRLVVFPRDAACFGIDPDALDVALALRMSAGIPIIYEPVRLRTPETGRRHLLVDGGMLSNFPLWLFDDISEDEVPVLGLRLAEEQPDESLAERLPVPVLARTRVGELINYVESLARTMMEAHDRRYLEAESLVRTINIPTHGIAATQFDLAWEQVEMLFQSGRDAVSMALVLSSGTRET